MDRFQQMEVFVAVADTGSFAKASARLNMSPPAVTRAIGALEERIGVRLLYRTTRSLSITEDGLRFLERARRLLDELEIAEGEAGGRLSELNGHLSVTTSVTLGRSIFAAIVRDYLRVHNRMHVSVLLLDRVVNLVEEGIDLAVRVGDLPDSSHMARRVGQVRRVLVASPKYLEARGTPQVPADLASHSFIAFTALMSSREWQYSDAGRVGRIELRPQFEINDAVTAIRAAEDGEGITIALSYMVHKQIAEGELQMVLESFCPPPVPVHIVYPHSRLLAPKIRHFIEFAAPRLKSGLLDAQV